MLEARIEKTLPGLRGLGDNWILEVGRKSSIIIFPETCTVEAVADALIKKKIIVT